MVVKIYTRLTIDDIYPVKRYEFGYWPEFK